MSVLSCSEVDCPSKQSECALHSLSAERPNDNEEVRNSLPYNYTLEEDGVATPSTCSLETDHFHQGGYDLSNHMSEKTGASSEEGISRKEIKIFDGSCKSNYSPTIAVGEIKVEPDAFQERADTLQNSGSVLVTYSDSQADGISSSTALHELSDIACRSICYGETSVQGQINRLFQGSAAIEQLNVSNQEAKCGNLETESSEQDYVTALWVMWRGKWQTGIRCRRVDCPISTLRAKPNHDRKKCFTVFLPGTRTYAWIDMLLVRPIDESPEPLACGTHSKWRALVTDLTLPRRHIMQKLAIAMLDMSDQLHAEAVAENARTAKAWNDFAMESSRSIDYSDLGRMLLKLQSMILPVYFSCVWLDTYFALWVKKCQSAQTAESVEVLTEELIGSVLWKEVEKLRKATIQPELDAEWKLWKREAVKWLSDSNPIINDANAEMGTCDNPISTEPQSSRKRPKLEVRRAIGCSVPMNGCSIISKDCISKACGPSKMDTLSQVATINNSVTASDRGFIVVVSQDTGSNKRSEIETSAQRESHLKPILEGNLDVNDWRMSRKCQAFLEAKGRQCGRWANDGGIYCSVHLSPMGSSHQEHLTPFSKTPMCKAKTNLGTSCKNHARPDSSFCKKHCSKSTQSMLSDNAAYFDNKLKRKNIENDVEKFPEPSMNACDELGLLGYQDSTQESLFPVKLGETLDERHGLMKNSMLYDAASTSKAGSPDPPLCIGHNGEKCPESPKWHDLYCEKHFPDFLKCTKDRSQLISKDVFLNVLRDCTSWKRKLNLHQACYLLYGFMNSHLTHKELASREDNMKWIFSEACKNSNVGECLLRLVSSEREKLEILWGFGLDNIKDVVPLETKTEPLFEAQEKRDDPGMAIKCRVCMMEFCDDQSLGLHWTEMHKKEARWLFKGYACAVCMGSFTNKKVIEDHMKKRHGMQFQEQSILFRCMSCNCSFMLLEQLWKHVLSYHLMDLKIQAVSQQKILPRADLGNKFHEDNMLSEKDDSQKRICRFCGLKFDLLPDLGRHHQVAHMYPNAVRQLPRKKNGHFGYDRDRCSRFRRDTEALRIINHTNSSMQKCISNSAIDPQASVLTQAFEKIDLGRLLDPHCSDIAKVLFSGAQKTIPRPNNSEVLSMARSACCRRSFLTALEFKYGRLPENLYLKAAKLCSELNFQVAWQMDGFICPQGCEPPIQAPPLAPLKQLPRVFAEPSIPASVAENDARWEMDECHYILDSRHFNWKPMPSAVILCKDLSFGRESLPIACVVDGDLSSALQISPYELSSLKELGISIPWLSYTYITGRLIDPSLDLDTKSAQMGCACVDKCFPENCDHVYLFDNDYENALDIHGTPMRNRFPYDEEGRVVLEEGYLVYECNSMCKCDDSCHNRVLQKGVQVKLEVFRTMKKGWAVRAGEAISRGTFVCEYVGEILVDTDANMRGKRSNNGCSYLYDIDAHRDNTKSLTEGNVPYVIDATKFGNISRFINHSCSPNLVNYQVLVESMDYQMAHIGFYANRDIVVGEELAYDYHQKLLPGDGCPCHCGAQNCRGRLY